MALTRAQVDVLMLGRVGRQLSYWQLDGTTADGTNADVGYALARAMLDVGDSVSDLTAPSAAEVAQVATADYPRLLDLTHQFLLEACLDNADVVREREGVNEQEWNGRLQELRMRLQQKKKDDEARYGDGAGSITGGFLKAVFLRPDPEDDLPDA